ncbi:FKBP-type peptidyl-prolyl cis-trans isomerase [Bacteroidota bacterium]
MHLIALLAFSSLVSCQLGQDDFTTTPGGLTYKFHYQNKAGVGVLPGDMVTLDLVFRTPDTIFFVSSRDLSVPYQFEVLEPRFPGDMYDAILLLAVGDSATFILDGDSLFTYDFEIFDLPDFINTSTDVYMDVKLEDVVPRDEFAEQKESYKGRVDKLKTELKEKEAADIQAFLQKNNFSVKPTESGLYFIELKKGSGPAVKPGKSVKVDYSAMFITREIFETSIREIAMKNDIFDTANTYQPFQYKQGDSLIIAGWNEGLSYMKQGGQAILVVPSSLAYGEEGVEGLIPPFTPFIYEIEVIEVK